MGIGKDKIFQEDIKKDMDDDAIYDDDSIIDILGDINDEVDDTDDIDLYDNDKIEPEEYYEEGVLNDASIGNE